MNPVSRLEWSFVAAYLAIVAGTCFLVQQGRIDPHAWYVVLAILVPSPATPLFVRVLGSRLFPAGANISIPPPGGPMGNGHKVVIPPEDPAPVTPRVTGNKE